MRTREIPRNEWQQFLDGFSRRHEGWLARLQVLSEDGAQVEADAMPLEGISIARPKGESISVALGESADDRVERIVEAPKHLFVEEAGSAELALQIEGGAGEKILLTFRSAMSTEMVDGVNRPTK